MKIRGSVVPLKVAAPRIQKFAPSAPGSPVRCIEITPAIRPANDVLRLLEGTRSSAGLMDCTAPTTLAFFCVPNPTTTTSSRLWASGTNLKTTIFFPFSRISTGVYPIKEATNVLFSGAINVKFPSTLVTVPNVLLPFITIFAPGIPSPFSSRT